MNLLVSSQIRCMLVYSPTDVTWKLLLSSTITLKQLYMSWSNKQHYHTPFPSFCQLYQRIITEYKYCDVLCLHFLLMEKHRFARSSRCLPVPSTLNFRTSWLLLMKSSMGHATGRPLQPHTSDVLQSVAINSTANAQACEERQTFNEGP